MFNVNISGYTYGLKPFEDEDYLLVVTWMKDLQVINLYMQKVVANVMTGLRNGSNLVHVKDQKRFLIPDPVYERVSIMKY